MPLYYFKLEDVTVAQIEAIKLARRRATLADLVDGTVPSP
jgi:hypothetical protein